MRSPCAWSSQATGFQSSAVFQHHLEGWLNDRLLCSPPHTPDSQSLVWGEAQEWAFITSSKVMPVLPFRGPTWRKTDLIMREVQANEQMNGWAYEWVKGVHCVTGTVLATRDKAQCSGAVDS